MSWNAQVATWTANNRYPGIFRTVQARILQTRGSGFSQAKLKVLSFGCSTGSEISTLRSYFPDAILYGCDVNADALKQASDNLLMDEAILFESSPENLRRYGPFDVIFAMSVLCRFPDSMDPKLHNLKSIYSFANFQSAVCVLTDNIREQGLLCLYNTNYSFTDLRVAGEFRVVKSAMVASNGFVDRFNAEGERVTWCEKIGPYYAHRMQREFDMEDGLNFIDCIFEKSGGDNTDVFVPVGEDVVSDHLGPAQLYRFGPDLKHCASVGLIATALGYWFEHDADGHRIVRAWHRTSSRGDVSRGKAWSVRSDPEYKALLSTEADLGWEHGASAGYRDRGRQIMGLIKGAGRRLAAR